MGEVYDVGGPEAVTYGEMLRVVGRMPGGLLKLIVPVPLLTARALIDSMSNEVVVRDRPIEELTGHRAMGFAEAAERALRDRAYRLARPAAV